MSYDAALYERMTTTSGLAALVGTRIYPAPMPQHAKQPVVVHQTITTVRDHVGGTDSGLVWAREQVDSYGPTFAGAQAVATQVRVALEDWNGTAAGTTVQWSVLDSEAESYDVERKTHRVTQDFIVWYLE